MKVLRKYLTIRAHASDQACQALRDGDEAAAVIADVEDEFPDVARPKLVEGGVQRIEGRRDEVPEEQIADVAPSRGYTCTAETVGIVTTRFAMRA